VRLEDKYLHKHKGKTENCFSAVDFFPPVNSPCSPRTGGNIIVKQTQEILRKNLGCAYVKAKKSLLLLNQAEEYHAMNT